MDKVFIILLILMVWASIDIFKGLSTVQGNVQKIYCSTNICK